MLNILKNGLKGSTAQCESHTKEETKDN